MINSETHISFKRLFLIIVINFILQSTLFQAIKINGISANYTLVLVILITIVYGLSSGLFTAVVAGLFVDVYLSMAIGINLFILVIISVFISFIGRPLFTGNKLTLVFMTVLSTIMYQLMYFFFMYFLNKGIEFSRVMVHIVPYESIFNSIICIVFYQVIIKWIERYKLD